MSRYPRPRHQPFSSVAPYTSSISAYAFPRSDPSQTQISAGKTCTVKTTTSHGSTGYVSDYITSRIGPAKECSNSTFFFENIKTVPTTCLLIILASLNTLFLFTHTKLYHLHLQHEPVASPHARFVSAPTDLPALASRLRTYAWGTFLSFWRFLLGITPSSSPGSSAYGGRRVQELEVWTPSEGELMLFCIYSPVHVVLWMLWNAGNWIMMAAVMAGISFQVCTILSSTLSLA